MVIVTARFWFGNNWTFFKGLYPYLQRAVLNCSVILISMSNPMLCLSAIF